MPLFDRRGGVPAMTIGCHSMTSRDAKLSVRGLQHALGGARRQAEGVGDGAGYLRPRQGAGDDQALAILKALSLLVRLRAGSLARPGRLRRLARPVDRLPGMLVVLEGQRGSGIDRPVIGFAELGGAGIAGAGQQPTTSAAMGAAS